MRRLLVIVSLSIAACGGPSAPEEQGGGAVIADRSPESQRTPGWLEFKDLSAHVATEDRKPIEPYVKGEWIGGRFDVRGSLVGKPGGAPRGRNVTRGWLELRNRAFHPFNSTAPKIAPFIEGFRDDDTGGFYPSADISWTAP